MTNLRYAFRSLARSKGFVVVAVLALGMGLGISTTMFAVLDAIVHPYVAYRDPDSLYGINWWWSANRGALTAGGMYRAVSDRLGDMGTMVPVGFARLALETADDSREIPVARVTPAFFTVTGVVPRLGRPFGDGDGEHVVVLSSALWRTLFPRRRTLDSATVTLGTTTFAVIGVMPRGSIAPGYASAWVPFPAGFDPLLTGAWPLARLKPGVAKERADAALKDLSQSLTRQFATTDRPVSIELKSITFRQEEVKDIHKAMVGASLCVLIIACVNLAHLMLARGLAKRRELALRMALGASRALVVRQMFLECAMITIAGAVLGAVAATWGADLLNNRMPEEVSWVGLMQPQLSWRVFALSAAAAAASAILFGLVPAIRVASGVNLDEPLKDGAGTTIRNRRRYSALVIGEVALALVLMMGGALLLRTIGQMQRVEYTFDASTLVTAQVGLRGSWKDTAGMIRRDAFSALVASVPGVREVAFSRGRGAVGGALTGEMTGGDSTRVISTQQYTSVSPNYLRVHGLPVIQGRDFEPGDATGNGAAILNASAAARLYPHGGAVGRMVKLGSPGRDAPWIPIIGVVRNAMVIRGGDEKPVGPSVYVAQPDGPVSWGFLMIRTAKEDPRSAVDIRRKLHSVANVWVMSVQPYSYDRDAELMSRRFLAGVFVTMGSVALALAALGLYGVLAFAVNQRMREFAVRAALGARPEQLFRMVMHDGAVMILAGTAVGAFGALATSRLLDAVLTSVLPSDVISLVACELVLIATGFLAAFTPARRAVHANPMDILRAV